MTVDFKRHTDGDPFGICCRRIIRPGLFPQCHLCATRVHSDQTRKTYSTNIRAALKPGRKSTRSEHYIKR
jgi:hypothetical protein